jgi:hypothetical protein
VILAAEYPNCVNQGICNARVHCDVCGLHQKSEKRLEKAEKEVERVGRERLERVTVEGDARKSRKRV